MSLGEGKRDARVINPIGEDNQNPLSPKMKEIF